MKKFIIYIALAVCAVGVHAQEMTPEEEAKLKREINEIKWKEDAVFAEIVDYVSDDSDKAVSQAQQQSMMKLQTVIVELFAQNMNMKKEDVQEIWDTIEDKCQNIEIRSGDVIRVFRYIPKALLTLRNSEVNLESNKYKKKHKELDEYFGRVPSSEQTATPVAPVVPAAPEQLAVATPEPKVEQEIVPVVTENNEEKKEVVAETKTVAETTTVATPVEEPKQETVVVTEEPVVSEVKKEEASTTPVAPATPVTPAVTPVVEPVAEVVVPELCKTMLTYKDQTSLVAYLQSEKAYENLIFGGYSSMRRPNDCYIVIIDKATRKIVTVLDKGVSERMNFVTKKMDNFENYRVGGKYSAVFVQETK